MLHCYVISFAYFFLFVILALSYILIFLHFCTKSFEKSGNWSEEGVTVLNATQDQVICTSTHLTSFAVLAKVPQVRIFCICSDISRSGAVS